MSDQDGESRYVEFCPNCSKSIGTIQSDPDSHWYVSSEWGDLLSHTSRVTCPGCGHTAQRTHGIPFRVRVQ